MNHEAKNGSAISVNLDVDRLALYIFIFCITFEVFLVILDLFINYGQVTTISAIRNLSNIAREDSLASWFSSTQTLLVGLTVLLIALLHQQSKSPRIVTIGWFAVSLFFFYLAVDDGAEVHERLGTAFTLMSENQSDNTSLLYSAIHVFPSYTWQLLFLPILSFLTLTLLIFLAFQFRNSRLMALIIFALLCLVIAVGLDFIEGLAENHPWNIHSRIRENLVLDKYTVSHMSKSLEEFLEMLGFTFFWVAFISYLKKLPSPGKYLLHFYPGTKNGNF